MMLSLSNVDIIILAAYFIGTFGLGIFSFRRHSRSAEEYVLAGRKLTLPAFVATLTATWYGGILGVGEFTYRHGVVNLITQGLFFYIFAAVFAVFLAKRIQRLNILTIPDRLEQIYGVGPALAGAVFIFIMTIPAPYVLIVGIMLQMLFGWSLLTSLMAGAAVSTIYLLIGGFRAVIRTDILQFLLMFAGFMVLIPFAFTKLGGLSYLTANLPDSHFSPTGGLGTGYIFVWGFIALWTLIDPGFYQRCLAAKSPSTARTGLFVSILFWVAFDILTCTVGLYARAFLPDIDPIMAYPLLADTLLPPGVKGLFFAGLLATVMSTLDSFTFLSALTLGNDFFARIRRQHSPGSSSRIPQYTRFGIIVSVLAGVLIAWQTRSVIDIWYTLGTIGIPALLIPVLCCFTDNYVLSGRAAFLSMILSGCTSFIWLSAGYMNSAGGFPSFPYGIEPMYPGLAVSVTFFMINTVRLRLSHD
jgi:SSS family solute:Na+ symporter